MSATDNHPLSGQWKNDMGSHVTFNVEDNKITGSFQSGVSSDGRQAPSVPVEGTVFRTDSALLITFYVVHEDYNSLTSWVGEAALVDNQIENDTFVMNYLYVQSNPDVPRWKSVSTFTNTFFRVKE